ncbi:MAG: hypothetical protein MUF33_06230 [Candidatus Nanopelagicales bacterium]|nr:hypothetical protein [Candidatus Nanopelagicales bacterium]
MTRPGGLRILFGLALALQFWALYVPRTPSVESGLPLDKAVHLGLFLVVTWLGLRVGLPRVGLVIAMVAQAAISELTQWLFLPQRGGDWWDFAADLAGIGLGVLLARDRSHRDESLLIDS